MIRIIGHSDHEDENIAAEKLKEAFIQWRPDITSSRDQVQILVAVQCPGSRSQQDIDLVVIARLHRPLEVRWKHPDWPNQITVLIWSFCATFEIKGHELVRHDGTPQIIFQDNKVDVRYGDSWHPATLQARGQGIAFMGRLKRESGVHIPAVSFVWLVRVTKEQIQGHINEPNSTLPASFDIPALGRKILDLREPKYDEAKGSWNYAIWLKDMDFELVSKRVTAKCAISPLNRATIDNVIKRRIDFKQFENLGSLQQLVSGRAGSGKTIVLLRTALEVYTAGKRVALLTYNKALVADINRLLMFMKVKGPSSKPNINIITLHSYFIAVITAIFPEDASSIDPTWLKDRYPERLKDSIQFLKAGAATSDDIKKLLIEQDFAVFDVACVDEGQDWLDDERDLLHHALGSSNCIVASGFDQLIRQDTLCDWTNSDAVATGITRLRKCLRMKTALASFANAVAQELGLGDWEIEPDDDLSGGNVVVLHGDYTSVPGLHRQLCELNTKAGNKNIDMLFCVEPGNVKPSEKGDRSSLIGADLARLGYSVWDATSDVNRKDPPHSVDDFRIVQFESCRGLEGWVVVAEHLDEFFRKKYEMFSRKPHQQVSFLDDRATEAKCFAALWSMIPLTRAIDTLVITLKDQESIFAQAVSRVAVGLRDVVRVLR